MVRRIALAANLVGSPVIPRRLAGPIWPDNAIFTKTAGLGSDWLSLGSGSPTSLRTTIESNDQLNASTAIRTETWMDAEYDTVEMHCATK
jgi:hypothetical protein